MQYSNVIPGRFVSRPNRFLAQVKTADGVQTCHVKNTGRCAELLLPGAPVWLQRFGTDAKRKTKFDLIAVPTAEAGQLYQIFTSCFAYHPHSAGGHIIP